MELFIAVSLVFLVNLPFGYWRASLKKLSVKWFVAIHAPVPFVVLIRYAFGLKFCFSILSLLIPAFFLGQYVGAKLRKKG